MTLALGYAAWLAGCSCASNPTHAACETAAQCPAGRVCSSGQCIAQTQCEGNANPVCQCDAACTSSCTGGGGGACRPFDPAAAASSDVGVDRNGFLILQTRELPKVSHIWISNSGPGTVSKFSTVDTNPDGTFKEVARYWTGPNTGYSWYSNGLTDGSRCTHIAQNGPPPNDPSRTSVNVYGDAFVANRIAKTVTKFAGVKSRCADRNRDGVIQTSEDTNRNGAIDGSEILPWGQDECMLWSTAGQTAGDRRVDDGVALRAIAAWDEPAPDFGWTSSVWVGDYNYVAYKLDSETGKVLLKVSLPVTPYGFAFDRSGQLWIAGLSNNVAFEQLETSGDGSIAKLDARACVDAEHCPIEKIATPRKAHVTYGITVDPSQNVWCTTTKVGASASSSTAFLRYSPATRAWREIAANVPSLSLNGVASDKLGYIYAAAMNDGVFVLDSAQLDAPPVRIPGTERGNYRGVGVDADGKIWAISVLRKPPSPAAPWCDNQQPDEYATVIEPQGDATQKPAALNAQTASSFFRLHHVSRADPQESAVGLNFPYIYSDMTGVQLRNATGKYGMYSDVFEACPGSNAVVTWASLHWGATVPEGTHLEWNARAADTAEGLASAPLIALGSTQGERATTSPIDLQTALGEQASKKFLRIGVELVVGDSAPSGATPVVQYFEATYGCAAQIN
jgi:sugar lactone lactonase YvrE